MPEASLEGLSVLILSKDLSTRTTIREVLRAILYRGHIEYCSSLREALTKIELAQPSYDLCTLAVSLGAADISAFLEKLKTSAGPVPRVIMALDSKYQVDPGTIAEFYLEGVRGFISQPYSSNEFLAILERSMSQPDARPAEQVRNQKACEYLLSGAVGYSDQLAQMQAEHHSVGGPPLKYLRQLSKKLRQLIEMDPDSYSGAIVRAFEQAKPFAPWAKERKVVHEAPEAVEHPGAVIQAIMHKRSLVTERITAIIKMDPADFDLLLKGDKAVDEFTARELARAFGKTATEWLRLQSDYDRWVEQQHKG